MNYNTTTQLEFDQALYIDKLEAAIDSNNDSELKEDRRYMIEILKVLGAFDKTFTDKEKKKIKEELIKLI